MASSSFFKKFRITILLLILAFVGLDSWLTKMRSTDWDRELWVIIHPINGDDSEASARYIKELQPEIYNPIESFMQREAQDYHLGIKNPFTIKLGDEVHELPPPRPDTTDIVKIAWWSLRTRYWAWRVDNYRGPADDIQLFVSYFDPEQHDVLDHSIGLQKGMLGLVNAYATRRMAAKNNFIIAHELLHTVGATDKYDFSTNQPLWPEGFADPEQQPLYPQTRAEIMGGRVPLSAIEAEMPQNLNYALIGPQTAREINWIK